jgi:CheY-specific phosphatase CheX
MPVEQSLREAAQFVLETMFFAESEPVAAPDTPQPMQISVQVSFQGQCRGNLAIAMPESYARAMAGSFEGLPDTENIPAVAVSQVAAELVNMICGATLARLNRDALFTLNSPSITPEFPLPAPESSASAPVSPSVSASVSECWLQIPYMGDGLMHLALALEAHP